MTLASTPTTAVSSKTYVHLSPSELASLQLRVYRHTSREPAPESVLQTFVDLINASFTGPYHDENFGRDQPRYRGVETLREDLDQPCERGGEGKGGWVFMLVLPSEVEKAVAGAKVTLSGARMDGGASIHTLPNPRFTPPARYPSSVYYLGALGTVTPGFGTLLLTHIKHFLSRHTPSYVLGAYTIAEWGINAQFSIPQESPLVRFFAKQGFEVVEYAWKPKGTWGSFYGGCLCSIEYVHVAGGADA
ncbi:uncharacterized protein SRS1_12994 [Sporisorium reilianum f. sp. reilianum]|uniref:N-acetyltransferase domain-containing protein n=1 Tax=Sporisorium reilianum f. sp. reilianum TaxID=72559 RepID=A0A2N8UAV9_9BASI|nr:uncharacterized protein SRS1_12994 [Sporisorium reilianum f. sp. reilianum]